MSQFDIPVLSSARLTLRALAAADLDEFTAMQADPEVMRHLGAGVTRSREETWDTMARMLGQWPLRGYGMFAVVETASGRFAGRAGILHPYAWAEPELAYGFDRPFWGRGYATEAAVALRDWAFARFAMPRLVSNVRPANTASINVLRKLGAELVGEAEMLGLPAEIWVHRRPTR
jgi:RimJ/RimL family protein N-acetyltransferase